MHFYLLKYVVKIVLVSAILHHISLLRLLPKLYFKILFNPIFCALSPLTKVERLHKICISLFADKPTVTFTKTGTSVTCNAESKPLSTIIILYTNTDGQNQTNVCFEMTTCQLEVLLTNARVTCQAAYQSEKISAHFEYQRSMRLNLLSEKYIFQTEFKCFY